MPKTPKVIIHVLVRRCATTHKWSAQGIEHDIVAQADTLKALEQRFIATVLAYVHCHPEAKDPLKDVGPAPKPFWNTLKKLQRGDRSSKIRSFPKQSKTAGEAVFLQAAA